MQDSQVICNCLLNPEIKSIFSAKVVDSGWENARENIGRNHIWPLFLAFRGATETTAR